MRHWRVGVLTALMSLIGGCSADRTTQQPSEGGEGPTAGLPDRKIELRLLGVNTTGYEWMALRIDHLSVTAAGRPLTFRPERTSRSLDPTRSDHAALLGVLELPPDVDAIDVELMFDDHGAHRSGGREGAIRSAGVPIRFHAERALLEKRGHGVIQLDLARSLRLDGLDRVLLPSTVVGY